MTRQKSNRQSTARGSEQAEPRFLIIGRIRKPHGVRGELKASVITDYPERFLILETVYISRRQTDDNPQPYVVESVRLHGEDALIKLEAHNSREEAAVLRQHWLQVPVEEAVPLAEGEYYLYQLIGLEVFTTDGERLGVLKDIIETSANNVFIVKGDDGEKLIPDIPEVVQSIDFKTKRMEIKVMDGLFG